MGWPADTLAGIYLFLFAFGALFSVAALLLGAAHGHLHLPGGHAGHAGHVAHAAGHGQAGRIAAGGGGHGYGAGQGHHGQRADLGSPSPVNATTVVMFLTWFGAAGYALRVYSGATPAASLFGAAPAGLAGAALLYLFLARVLWRGQTELDPANYVREGVPGRVTSPIRAGGVGEIVYIVDGKQAVDGARSADGGAIGAGAEIEIVGYEGGLAWVRPRDGARDDGPFLGRPIDPEPVRAPRSRTPTPRR